jgi:hypothetical protein
MVAVGAIVAAYHVRMTSGLVRDVEREVEAAEMSSHFDAIWSDADEVSRLGGANLGTIRDLKLSLDAFARADGAPAEKGIRVKSDVRGAD